MMIRMPPFTGVSASLSDWGSSYSTDDGEEGLQVVGWWLLLYVFHFCFAFACMF